MSKIIIVHGVKPKRNQALRYEFQSRLDAAVQEVKNHSYDYFLVTGGKTVGRYPSEAEIAQNYLKDKIKIPLLLEDQSRTTSENVRYTKTLIESKDISVRQCKIVLSKDVKPRTYYLYRRLWPEIVDSLSFLLVNEHSTLFAPVMEPIYHAYAYLDPEEKFFTRITKRLFRTGS